ncbi:hypothetical protein F4808DRAFT_397721 [Astrocystis sublimbata]|nr:hypothetical protein F4808DRAFT_397368 [Astrocystis sublimbata]KAI0191123.1 hypothetical protein F4808DRAFT_397721 [Astrocystis sublimbata]
MYVRMNICTCVCLFRAWSRLSSLLRYLRVQNDGNQDIETWKLEKERRERHELVWKRKRKKSKLERETRKKKDAKESISISTRVLGAGCWPASCTMADGEYSYWVITRSEVYWRFWHRCPRLASCSWTEAMAGCGYANAPCRGQQRRRAQSAHRDAAGDGDVVSRCVGRPKLRPSST